MKLGRLSIVFQTVNEKNCREGRLKSSQGFTHTDVNAKFVPVTIILVLK